jgi:hypothetical protein
MKKIHLIWMAWYMLLTFLIVAFMNGILGESTREWELAITATIFPFLSLTAYISTRKE